MRMGSRGAVSLVGRGRTSHTMSRGCAAGRFPGSGTCCGAPRFIPRALEWVYCASGILTLPVFLPVSILWTYLRQYWKLILLALVLATINQVFSLLDPLIFRYVIDNYATRFQEYTTAQFFRGVGLLLAAAVGVAFVSRVAKNFQDYVVKV